MSKNENLQLDFYDLANGKKIKSWAGGFKENNILCSGKLISLFMKDLCFKNRSEHNVIPAWRVSVLDFTK